MHREQFVDNYIPMQQASNYLFYGRGKTNGLEERIDKFVATKYLLHYDEATKSTVVKEGYFA